MNISDVKSLEKGAWINEPVVGTISSAKNIQTSKGTKGAAKFGDGTDTIDIESWNHSFTSYAGKTVEISGKGNKRDEYNGYAKFAMGKGAKITVVGDAPATADDGIDHAPQVQRPAAPKETFDEAYFRRVKRGFELAEDLEAEFDGRLSLTSEDKRAIAIGYSIGAERAGA